MRRVFALFLCLSLLVFPVKAAENEKYVALTFDDGPSGKFTRRLLAGLEEREVKATFLLCGYRLKDYGDTARMIQEGGHEIGLHGYSHDCMGDMSAAQVSKEIRETLALLPQGCTPAFLRPPGGKSSDAVRQAAREAGLAILTWSLDPRDWATSDKNAIVRSVVNKVQDGDVILLHDMTTSSINAALEIVDILKDKGYTFVTVSQLAALRDTQLIPGNVYWRFS